MAFYTRFKSTFLETQKLTVQIAFALLFFSSPLLLCNTSSAAQKVLMPSQQKQNKTPVNVETSLNTKCNSSKQCSEINTTLKNYTSQDTKAIRVFQKYLKDPNKQVRIFAVTALMAIGTGADGALDNLKDLLKTERDTDVLSSVIKAIQSINAKRAIPELTKIFKDEQQNLQVRSLAVEALKTRGADEQQSKEIILLLFKSLKDQSVDKTNLRIKASDALSFILPRNDIQKYPDAVAILTGSLKDPAWQVRRSAVDTLGNIGVYAKSSVPQIIEAYKKDLNYTMQASAVTALGNIGQSSVNDKGNVNDQELLEETASHILPELNEVLKNDESLTVRSRSAEALGNIATKFELAAKNNKLATEVSKEAISQFKEAFQSVEKLKDESSSRQNIESSLQELNNRQFINESLKNPGAWGIGIYLLSLVGIFWLRPSVAAENW